MANRYPLVANSELNRIEELKETDFLTLLGTGIVNATSIESKLFFGDLIGTANTSLSLFDASKITLGIVQPERLAGQYDIGVTTSQFLQSAANILSGTVAPERLDGLYNIDISGTADNADFLNNAANILNGIVPRERLTGSYDIDITGAASTSIYSEFSEKAKFANFSVGTAIEVFDTTEDKVLYPAILAGAGITYAEVSLDKLSFNPSSGNLGIGTSIPNTSLQVNIYGVDTGIGTFLAQPGVYSEIDSFDVTQFDFKTAEYTIHLQYGSAIQSQKVLVMQNGIDAYEEQYAIMSQPSLIVSLGSTISGSDCLLRALPENGVSGIVTYRFSRNTLL